jgi:hypothetical protein
VGHTRRAEHTRERAEQRAHGPIDDPFLVAGDERSRVGERKSDMHGPFSHEYLRPTRTAPKQRVSPGYTNTTLKCADEHRLVARDRHPQLSRTSQWPIES